MRRDLDSVRSYDEAVFVLFFLHLGLVQPAPWHKRGSPEGRRAVGSVNSLTFAPKHAERRGCKWQTAMAATCLQSALKTLVDIWGFFAPALKKKEQLQVSDCNAGTKWHLWLLLVFRFRLTGASLLCSILLGLFVLRAKMQWRPCQLPTGMVFGHWLITTVAVPPLLISEGGFYEKEAKIDLLAFGLHTRTTLHQNPSSDDKLICHGSASTHGRVWEKKKFVSYEWARVSWCLLIILKQITTINSKKLNKYSHTLGFFSWCCFSQDTKHCRMWAESLSAVQSLG